VKMPELPDIIWNTLPEGHTFVTKRIQETNYLQAVEGGVDSSHVSILHAGHFRNLNVFDDNSENVMLMETVPHPIFEVAESEFGAYMGAGRITPKGNVYWRVNCFLMPWYTLVPPYENEPRTSHAWVPIDDYNCMNWSINWHPERPLREEELANMKGAKGIHGDLIPGTFRTRLNRDNNYGLDRELQRKGESLSGIRGVGMQDAAIQESQGYIPGVGALANRTKERLGTSDSAIIAMRRILMNAVKGFQLGNLPKSLSSSYYIQPPTKHLPKGVSITEALIPEFEEQAERSKRIKENEKRLKQG